MRIINEKDNPKLFVVWDYLFYRNTGNKFLNLLYLIKINLILESLKNKEILYERKPHFSEVRFL